MKKLCIIPARGGSKRLPRKNIKLLNGKPLVFYTIDAVLKSEIFDKVIFTSDDDEILKVVQANYSSTNLNVIKRLDYLTTDTSKVIDTVMYYLNENKEFEQCWLMLPTCPLRTYEDILSVNKMLTKELDSVISITEMEFPPSLGLNKDESNLITAYDNSNPWVNGNSRSQDHPIVYRPNGAIYASWSDRLMGNKNFYKGKVKGYFMDREKSIDIDTQFDFDLAINIINKNK